MLGYTPSLDAVEPEVLPFKIVIGIISPELRNIDVHAHDSDIGDKPIHWIHDPIQENFLRNGVLLGLLVSSILQSSRIRV